MLLTVTYYSVLLLLITSVKTFQELVLTLKRSGGCKCRKFIVVHWNFNNINYMEALLYRTMRRRMLFFY